jgi:hypothetical protein
MANKQQSTPAADKLIGRAKRVVGYAGTFGVLGFFLAPLIPFVAVPATIAVVTGMATGTVVAVKTDKK